VIDLFSDTHTVPDEGMRRAMAAAEVGDEQMGEDPTTRRLQDRVAELFGKEAALLLPSGSMCNKVAVGATTRPGDAVVCDQRSHVFRFEGGGPSALFGVTFEPIASDDGHFTADALRAVMNPGSVYQPRTAVVALEQTHNFAGGTVWPIDRYEEVCAVAREHGAAVYTDGARVMNAIVASGVPGDRWAAPVDGIWLDFSKGLGGPGGAAIAGSAEFVAAANRIRFLLGGGMRQSGFLAAAALYGLDHNVDRLADDHANARRLADGLTELGFAVTPPDTNIVVCTPPAAWGAADLVAALGAEGLRVSTIPGGIRLVTHLGVTAKDVERALEIAARVVGSV
jgi:threonine aldolase